MDTIKSILCPIDFSEGSDRALDQAVMLARATGASIQLLHVYQLPVLALPDGAVVATPEFVAKLISQAQEALDQHRERLAGQGVSVTTRLVEGEPVQTILGHAKEQRVSMLVLGTHGRGGFKRFALGSTTEQIVRRASVPVLTVHLTE